MSGKNWGKFVHENIVFLVIIPMVIGVHWGWWRLQQNPVLVDPKERHDLPIYTIFKKILVKENLPHEGSKSEDKGTFKS